jgi:hypothetical protein
VVITLAPANYWEPGMTSDGAIVVVYTGENVDAISSLVFHWEKWSSMNQKQTSETWREAPSSEQSHNNRGDGSRWQSI